MKEIITANGRYVLRQLPNSFRWEVDHYWLDGVTIQSKYFCSKKKAEQYFNEKKGI